MFAAFTAFDVDNITNRERCIFRFGDFKTYTEMRKKMIIHFTATKQMVEVWGGVSGGSRTRGVRDVTGWGSWKDNV